MDQVTKRRLDEFLEDGNVFALHQELENNGRNFERYQEIQHYLQKRAPELASRKGLVVTPGPFAFQELVYLEEKQALSKVVAVCLRNTELAPVKRYLESGLDIRRAMLIFELLCELELPAQVMRPASRRSPQKFTQELAQIIHICLQRLLAKRDVDQLLEMLVEAVPRDSALWNTLLAEIAKSIDADFAYFEEDVQIVTAMEKLDYGSFEEKLDDKQKTLLLPHLLERLGLSFVTRNLREYIAAASKTNSFSWLEKITPDKAEAYTVASIVVRETLDWDLLLQKQLSKEFLTSLVECIHDQRNEMDTAFYGEVLAQTLEKSREMN